jgi:hypothetical protein
MSSIKFMFGWIKNRKGIATEADLLIQVMGDNALSHITKRSRNTELSERERIHALAVQRAVEKKLGIFGRQTDTGTRYVERD